MVLHPSPCLSGLVGPDLAAPDRVFKFHSGGHGKAPRRRCHHGGFDGHPGRTSWTHQDGSEVTPSRKHMSFHMKAAKNDSNSLPTAPELL